MHRIASVFVWLARLVASTITEMVTIFDQVILENETMRDGYRVVETSPSIDAVIATANDMFEKHGRWPTHMALPNQNIQDSTYEFLVGSSLVTMPLTASFDKVWLGYQWQDSPVTDKPAWLARPAMLDEFVDKVANLETSAEPEVDAKPEEVATEVEMEMDEFLAMIAGMVAS